MYSVKTLINKGKLLMNYGPVHFSGTLCFQGDSKADRKDLTAYGESAEAALLLSGDRIKELEALWSATDGNSDIYKVNQSGGTRTEVRA